MSGGEGQPKNEPAAAGLPPTTARNEALATDRSLPHLTPTRSHADAIRERIRGIKRARRLIAEARTISSWRHDSEAMGALAHASAFLGRERLKLLDELEREEASW